MKKLVPDPPPVLSIRPGLTHDEAIHTATEHLATVISALDALPDQAKSTVSVPIT